MNPTPGLTGQSDWAAVMKQSSFGPGALLLGKQARFDLAVFYAYCRAIDDCADEFAAPEARRHLQRWKAVLGGKPAPVQAPLPPALLELCKRRAIPKQLLLDLWQGAWADAHPPVRFKTFAQVQGYAYRVAGAVGLACLPIFGVDIEKGRAFAVNLGEAFQLINIIRDAAEDAAHGRLYVALDDLKDHGLDAKAFMSGAGGVKAERLFTTYAWRARQALARAEAGAVGLPKSALRTPLLMRALYEHLLEVMSNDRFQVFAKRYKLRGPRKRHIVATALVGLPAGYPMPAKGMWRYQKAPVHA